MYNKKYEHTPAIFNQKNDFAAGFEVFNVRKRDYKIRFGHLDYTNTIGSVNFYYRNHKYIPFDAKISYGEYLAGDVGSTIELSRSFKTGLKFGVFASFTDVTSEQFGEGSFDKGFYFQIPMDLFSASYSGNYSTFKLSPLTRDGGAKLIHDKDLKGLIYNSTYYELSQQWRGLLN